MNQILFRLDRRVKQQVRAVRRGTRDKALAMRCQIILLADKQRSRASIAESVGCSVSWVQRVLRRFREFGVPGLYDAWADNGTVKLDEHYLSLLYETVDQSPNDYHYIRPTWTQELLAKVMAYRTGVRITQAAVAAQNGKVKLHFLPPYTPDGNDIERTWLDLHANVTRNHRCSTISELMANVYEYLRNRNRSLQRQAGKAA